MHKKTLFILLFTFICQFAYGITDSLRLNPYTNKFDFTVAAGGIELSDIDNVGDLISNEAYDEGTWNGVETVAPSKDAVRDKIEALILGGGGTIDDDVTVNGSAVDTTANFKDTTTVGWTLVDGGAGGPDDVQAAVIAIGDTGNIQYNNADALTAAAGLNWDNANNALQIRGEIDAKSVGSALTRLQVLPYAEDSVWLGFDVAFNGADWVSSDAGSNYAVAKVGDQLRFYGDGGIAVGSNATLEILGYFDYTGFFHAYNVMQTGHNGLDGGVWIYSEQGGTDYTLKLLPNDAMTSDASFYFPADEPAANSFMTVTTGGVMGFAALTDYLATNGTDTIKDTHIDWGTGAGQVSTTDMTEGTNLYFTNARVTALIDTFAELDAVVADKALVNKADGAVWSGVHDFGGATSFELPNSDASPSVAGQLRYDTTVAGLANGALAYFGADVRYLVDLDTLPSNDDYVVSYDADADKFYMKADATGAGGSGSVTTMKEATVQVGGADIVTLDFGAGFDLTEDPDTEINITIDLSEIAAGGELGGNMDAPTIDDSLAVSSWNLTTPTITTSLTTDGKTISEAEIGVLDGGIEGTEILSTGEAGGTKFLREDGDGTCSWQTPAGGAGGATYREITFLPESGVLDDTNPPLISVKESTGTGTPRFRVAQFDDGEDDKLYWTFVMPSDATASADLILDIYSYSDEDVNEDVVWAVQVSATSDNDADSMEEQAGDTADTATENYDKTEAKALCLVSLTIDYANCDGAVAGDVVTLCFYRDGDNASDTHTNEVFLHSVHLKIPRS